MAAQDPPNDAPAEQYHVDLSTKRAKLIDSGIYIGEPDYPFLGAFAWEYLGRRYQLVANNNERPAARGEKVQVDQEPAVLSVVVKISYDDCRITPCGYWDGPHPFTKRFEDLKLSFQGERPGHGVFAQDFDRAIKSIRQLLKSQIEAVDLNAEQKGFLIDRGGQYYLRFRHPVFERNCNDTVKADPQGQPELSRDEVLALTQWPIINRSAEDARQEMLRSHSHRVVGLPAYDVKGDVIQPHNYESALRRALVRVTFTLSHWYFTGMDPHHTFVADVQSIRVLSDPPPVLQTPKRKTAKRDPEEYTPSRRWKLQKINPPS